MIAFLATSRPMYVYWWPTSDPSMGPQPTLLFPDETPKFIDLQNGHLHVAHEVIVQPLAAQPHPQPQAHHRLAVDIAHARCGPLGTASDERRDNLYLLLKWQRVHEEWYVAGPFFLAGAHFFVCTAASLTKER